MQYGFHSSSVDQLVYVRHAIIFATCSETESLKTLWGCGYELFGLTFDFQYISTSVLFLILNLFHIKANICVISVFWILPTRLPILQLYAYVLFEYFDLNLVKLPLLYLFPVLPVI